MHYTVVSFYANAGATYYEDHAKRLEAQCEKLGLDHHIRPLEGHGDYYLNTRMKPGFILGAIHELQGPVLWLDVDTDLFNEPIISKEFTGHLGAMRKWDPPYTHFLYSHVLYFPYCLRSLNLLDEWKKACDARPREEKISDHGVLIEVINKSIYQYDIWYLPFEESVKLGIAPTTLVPSKTKKRPPVP